MLEGGARAATIDAIAASSGAPKGSLYHRFASLDDLLAEMWLRAARRAQEPFIAAVALPEPMQAAVAAALSLHDFALSNRPDARLLASLRREDLIDTPLNPRLARELSELNRPLENVFASLARRLFGRASRANIEATVCAVADLPLGAIRRHLIAGSSFPTRLRTQIEAAVGAALTEAGA